MSTEPRDEIERRWQSLDRGWEPLLRCPLLHALVMLWVRMPAQSLRDVSHKYIEGTRTDIPAWLDFAPMIAACFQALLPEWRNDCPNIMDSAAWEHDEALRICAMVHELRRRAFAEAVRYQERNRSPAVILKLVPNA